MCRFVIDLKAILNNFNCAKGKLCPGVKICAVVKANAYGFGSEKIAKLLDKKADYFAVARLSEFLRLKKIGIKTPVIILSSLLENDMKVAIKNGAELTVTSVESLKTVNDYAKSNKIIANVHLKVDTGMSRFGFNDLKEFKTALKLAKKCEFISVNGVYSHFYDSDDVILEKQYNEFEKYRALVLKYKIKPIFHIASSSALSIKKYQFDMVRLGIDLYLSENHSFETNILQIKNLKAGDKVGYGGTFKAQKNMKIAVCGAGYADGVCRKLSGIGSVLIGDKIVPIVGRICMDSFMIDISNIDVKVGDKVLIFGKMRENYISVCEVANKCDTIPYEIYTNISSRVKRVYRWGDYAGNFRKI